MMDVSRRQRMLKWMIDRGGPVIAGRSAINLKRQARFMSSSRCALLSGPLSRLKN